MGGHNMYQPTGHRGQNYANQGQMMAPPQPHYGNPGHHGYMQHTQQQQQQQQQMSPHPPPHSYNSQPGGYGNQYTNNMYSNPHVSSMNSMAAMNTMNMNSMNSASGGGAGMSVNTMDPRMNANMNAMSNAGGNAPPGMYAGGMNHTGGNMPQQQQHNASMPSPGGTMTQRPIHHHMRNAQNPQNPQQVADSILQMTTGGAGGYPAGMTAGPMSHMNKYSRVSQQGMNAASQQQQHHHQQQQHHMMQQQQQQQQQQQVMHASSAPPHMQPQQQNAHMMGGGGNHGALPGMRQNNQFVYPSASPGMHGGQSRTSPMSPIQQQQHQHQHQQVCSPASVHSNHSMHCASPGPVRSPAPQVNTDRSPASVSSPNMVSMRSPSVLPQQALHSPANMGHHTMRSPIHNMQPISSPVGSQSSHGSQHQSPAAMTSLKSPSHPGHGHFSPPATGMPAVTNKSVSSPPEHCSPQNMYSHPPQQQFTPQSNAPVYSDLSTSLSTTTTVTSAGSYSCTHSMTSSTTTTNSNNNKNAQSNSSMASLSNPLQSLQKLVMLPESQVVDPKSVVNDACMPGLSSPDSNQKNLNSSDSRSSIAGSELNTVSQYQDGRHFTNTTTTSSTAGYDSSSNQRPDSVSQSCDPSVKSLCADNIASKHEPPISNVSFTQSMKDTSDNYANENSVKSVDNSVRNVQYSVEHETKEQKGAISSISSSSVELVGEEKSSQNSSSVNGPVEIVENSISNISDAQSTVSNKKIKRNQSEKTSDKNEQKLNDEVTTNKDVLTNGEVKEENIEQKGNSIIADNKIDTKKPTRVSPRQRTSKQKKGSPKNETPLSTTISNITPQDDQASREVNDEKQKIASVEDTSVEKKGPNPDLKESDIKSESPSCPTDAVIQTLTEKPAEEIIKSVPINISERKARKRRLVERNDFVCAPNKKRSPDKNKHSPEKVSSVTSAKNEIVSTENEILISPEKEKISVKEKKKSPKKEKVLKTKDSDLLLSTINDTQHVTTEEVKLSPEKQKLHSSIKNNKVHVSPAKEKVSLSVEDKDSEMTVKDIVKLVSPIKDKVLPEKIQCDDASDLQEKRLPECASVESMPREEPTNQQLQKSRSNSKSIMEDFENSIVSSVESVNAVSDGKNDDLKQSLTNDVECSPLHPEDQEKNVEGENSELLQGDTSVPLADNEEKKEVIPTSRKSSSRRSCNNVLPKRKTSLRKRTTPITYQETVTSALSFYPKLLAESVHNSKETANKKKKSTLDDNNGVSVKKIEKPQTSSPPNERLCDQEKGPKNESEKTVLNDKSLMEDINQSITASYVSGKSLSESHGDKSATPAMNSFIETDENDLKKPTKPDEFLQNNSNVKPSLFKSEVEFTKRKRRKPKNELLSCFGISTKVTNKRKRCKSPKLFVDFNEYESEEEETILAPSKIKKTKKRKNKNSIDDKLTVNKKAKTDITEESIKDKSFTATETKTNKIASLPNTKRKKSLSNIVEKLASKSIFKNNTITQSIEINSIFGATDHSVVSEQSKAKVTEDKSDTQFDAVKHKEIKIEVIEPDKSEEETFIKNSPWKQEKSFEVNENSVDDNDNKVQNGETPIKPESSKTALASTTYNTPTLNSSAFNDTAMSSSRLSSSPGSSSKKKRGRPTGSKNRLKKKLRKSQRDMDVFDYNTDNESFKSLKLNKTSHMVASSSGNGKKKKLKVDLPQSQKGPYIHLVGSRMNPVAVEVVNTREKMENDGEKTSKKKSSKHSERFGDKGLNPNSFVLDNTSPWLCALCGKGSSYQTMGDLFGPYYLEQPMSPHKIETLTIKPVIEKEKRKRKKNSKFEDSGEWNTDSKQQRRSSGKSSKNSASGSWEYPTAAAAAASDCSGEVWLHEECVVWSHGVYLTGSGKLQGLDEMLPVARQTVSCSRLILQ